MAIKPNFTDADVKKRFDKFLAVVDKRIIARLQKLGEMCVAHAKEVPPAVGFYDQTGNLRSSIGYMVFKNGVAVHEGYQLVEGTNQDGEALNGAEGIKAGKKLAMKVGKKYKEGYALVVTAGMYYAIYLESESHDVLTSAESLAKQELPKMLKKLTSNINKALSE